MRCVAPLTALRRAEQQFRAAVSRDSTRLDLAGWHVHIWPQPDPFYRNTALPIDERALDEKAIAAMTDGFASRAREPRTEFFVELWPGLEEALVQSGFVVEMRAEVLATTSAPEHAHDHADEAARLLGASDDSDAFLAAAEACFDYPGPTSDDERRRLRDDIARGRTLAAWVVDEDRPVAGASLSGISEVAELVGVWSLPSHRGRGLARAACTKLLEAFFTNGGEMVWLSAGGAGSLPLYQGLGFEICGTQVNLRQPR